MNLDEWEFYKEYIIETPNLNCDAIEERHYKRYIKEISGVWYYQDVLDTIKTLDRKVISECNVSYDLRHSERVFNPYTYKCIPCECGKGYLIKIVDKKLCCAHCGKEII